MKVDYFAQKAPDADDTTLARMVRAGAVPAGCLWGGEMVRFVAEELREDPCARCDCPKRDVCKGRPRASAPSSGFDRPESDVTVSSNVAVAARRLERASFIRDLLAMDQPGE